MLYTIAETTYAPQGDENPTILYSAPRALLKQLTPRKGTRTSEVVAPALWLLGEITYAPQGDENSIVIVFTILSSETTYAPQGDENWL